MLRPGLGVAQRLRQQRIGHLANRGGILGDGYERLGQQQPSRRMLPSRQDLVANRLRGLEVDQRLVVGNDLSRFDGAFHFRLKLDALLQSFVHGAVEEAVLTASLRLCPIHGHVRLPQRGFDIGAVTLGHRIIAVGTWIAGGHAHAYANLERQGGKRSRL